MGIILGHLFGSQDGYTRENRAGLRPCHGYDDHVFILRRISNQRYTFRGPKVFFFPDPKSALGSVGYTVLLKMCKKNPLPFESLRVVNQSQLHIRQLPACFFLPYCAIEVTMKIFLILCENKPVIFSWAGNCLTYDVRMIF